MENQILHSYIEQHLNPQTYLYPLRIDIVESEYKTSLRWFIYF